MKRRQNLLSNVYYNVSSAILQEFFIRVFLGKNVLKRKTISMRNSSDAYAISQAVKGGKN